jgi:hypothetical protein
MKMKNLGKIFILLWITLTSVFASVETFVDHRSVAQGDSVTFRINVSGDDIEAPQIDQLCGSDVLSSSSQQSIQIINGNITKNYSFIYTFEPEKSCTIQPIPIVINGTIKHTKPIKIKVTHTQQQNKDDNFILELSANKKEVFVGEGFDVVLTFKQKKSAQAIDSKFYPPKLDGFWIKYQSQPQKSTQGDYIVTKIHYKMAAQREGELTITPAKIKIARREYAKDYWNSFAPSVKWYTYYSNGIKMKVYAPPAGIKLVGVFDISIEADKTTVHPNEAVTVILRIKGDGNIEDLEPFNPYIKDANVFEEKPKIDQKEGVFEQKITFVADTDFTIPSFSIRFFDPKTKKIITKRTEPISIHVVGSTAKEQKVVIKKAEEKEQAIAPSSSHVETSFAITWVILSFIAGAFSGGAFVFLKFNPSLKKQKKHLSIKDKRVLFIKLLPYKDNKDVKEILDLLEEELYEGKTSRIDKQKLKEVINKYNIT